MYGWITRHNLWLVEDALDAAAENDLIQREIEEENKMMKDLKSDESRYPEIKLNKYTFKVLKNQELPG